MVVPSPEDLGPVVVTGVSSFVGMHLARHFASKGHAVKAVTSHPVDAYDEIRAERLATLEGQVEWVQCDLTNADQVTGLVSSVRPSLWIQHAGYADNYHSRDYDLGTSLAMNVLALSPLYQALSGTDCGVIVTGSSMEYAASDDANVESDACWPDFPYGVSKLMEATEANRLALEYSVPTRVARLYIPVGPYDAPGKLMEGVVKALLNGENFDLSPCLQRRDFLGVDDICEAYVLLATDMPRQMFDVFNVCSGQALKLRTLLEKIADVIGADRTLLNFEAREMRPGEPMTSYGDNTKAKTILNWQPKEIDHALKSLIEHVRTSGA